MSQRVTRAGSSGGMELQKWPRHDHKPLPEQLRFNSCRHRLHRMRHHSKADQYTPLVGQLELLGYMVPAGVGGLLHESLTGFWDV